MATKLIVIRHGSTKLNGNDGSSSECIRGWLDVPLSPKGIKEAEKTADELKKHDFDCIICSDLDRAEHTARIISKATGVPFIGAHRGLRPWDVGDYTGKKIEHCLEVLQDYIKNKPATKMPNGESFDEFKNRFLNALDEIRRKHDGKTVAIVTHHRNERLMAGWKESGGGPAEKIKPDAFMHKGIPPADFIRHTLAAGDKEEADAKESEPAPKKRKAPARKAKPKNKDPNKVFSRPLNDAGKVKTDPMDLKPKNPATKTAPTWSSSVKGSLLER